MILHRTLSRYGRRFPCLSFSQKCGFRERSISEPFCQEARQNGPLPSGLSAKPLSPTFSAYPLDTMAVPHKVRYERNDALPSGSVITTVCGSCAVICMSFGYCQLTMASGLLARWKENTTSSAVIGEPSQNFASGNRWKVNTLPTGLTSQDCAM